MVLANRELVREVTSEKIREGMVVTPEMVFACKAGRERMKIFQVDISNVLDF